MREPYQKNINLNDSRYNNQYDTPSKTKIQNNQICNSQFDTPSGREHATPSLTTHNNLRLSKRSRNPSKIIINENSERNPNLVHR